MIKIIVINNNKIIVEASKKTRLEKKEYAKKDRYTFIRPNNIPKRKYMCVPRKKLSGWYKSKFTTKKKKKK